MRGKTLNKLRQLKTNIRKRYTVVVRNNSKGFILLPLIILGAIVLTVGAVYIYRLSNSKGGMNLLPSPTPVSQFFTPKPTVLPTPTLLPAKTNIPIKTLLPTHTPIPTSKPTSAPTSTPRPTSTATPWSFPVRLTGQVYEDANCNDMQEPDEKGIPGVTINIILTPSWILYSTVTSDSNGDYTYATTLPSQESYITFRPAYVALPGYNIHTAEHDVTLSVSQSSMNINLPLVPSANIGQCH